MISELNHKPKRAKIGLRTLKTAAAVVISMAAVNIYGATTSKLSFAMLGAMAAMQPTFKESLESCLTQFLGVFFGAIVAVFLIMTPINPLISAGIGIILVITLYNSFRIEFSPSLPCLIVVTLCTTPDIQPFTYAVGRFWDTLIGLAIGLMINALIFPYDNSQQILSTAKSLEQELIRFLEEMFDGDDDFPNTGKFTDTIDNMNQQLKIFSNQRKLFRLRRRHVDYEMYLRYEEKARFIVAHMEVLCQMGKPGILSDENHERLLQAGANIHEKPYESSPTDKDIITNYHVTQLIELRQELLDALKG